MQNYLPYAAAGVALSTATAARAVPAIGIGTHCEVVTPYQDAPQSPGKYSPRLISIHPDNPAIDAGTLCANLIAADPSSYRRPFVGG
jgi:hypothetical protein